jgi:hypothetical protein
MGWERGEKRGRGTMKRIGGRRGMLFLFIANFGRKWTKSEQNAQMDKNGAVDPKFAA